LEGKNAANVNMMTTTMEQNFNEKDEEEKNPKKSIRKTKVL
jgi:hypothetical protein